MQTYSQTFATAQTWEMNVAGSYFAIVECLYSVNVRFYKGGTQLELGEIKAVQAGLEATLGPSGGPKAFDRVQIDVQAGETIKIGIGNGQVRYSRANEVQKTVVARSGAFDNQPKTVGTASAVLLAANSARQYLLVQNNDTSSTLYLAFGKPAAVAGGVRVIPGGAFELIGVCTTQDVYAIASVANPNVTTVEG